jgi:hypothetical protein
VLGSCLKLTTLDFLARKKDRPFGTASSRLLNIGQSGEEGVLASIFAAVIEDEFGGVETSDLTVSSERVSFGALAGVAFEALEEFGGFCEVEGGFVDLLRVTVYVVREQLFQSVKYSNS